MLFRSIARDGGDAGATALEFVGGGEVLGAAGRSIAKAGRLERLIGSGAKAAEAAQGMARTSRAVEAGSVARKTEQLTQGAKRALETDTGRAVRQLTETPASREAAQHPAHPDNAIGRNNRNYNPEQPQKISNNRGADKPSPNAAAQRTGSDIPYNSRTIRAELEAKYGRGNVTSTTVPPANAPNVRYAGRKHPDSGVVFDHKGFPIFDDIAKYDTRLDQNAFYATDRRGQMRMATRDLREQINSGKISRSQFSPEQLKAIQSGMSKIPDHSWHTTRSEERRVGKECRSRWSPYH